MEPVKQLVKDVLKWSVVLNGVAAVVCTLFVRPLLPAILGLLLGGGFGMWNFFELSRALSKSVAMTTSGAQIFVGTRYFLRYTLTAVILFVAIKVTYFNIFTVLFGILSIKFVVYAINFINKKV